MASRTESSLADAWRSLGGTATDEGWRLIQVDGVGPAVFLAGRRFPGNSEALLASFPSTRMASGRQLPQARGFEVARVELPGRDQGCVSIAVVREPAGSLELFETMAEDIIRALHRSSHARVEELLELFLRRVAAWQDFMRRPGDQRLSNEQEVGLYGELLMLERMLEAGVTATELVEGWEGPIDGLQDFVLGAGAIEVKSTISVDGFPARIGSLEQLDDAVRQPLFLAAQRIAAVPDGVPLPGLVERLRVTLRDSGAGGLFELRLRQGGFLDEHSDQYTRCFASAGERLFLVNESFPRLITGTVSPAIRSAMYSIEVDQIDAAPVPLHNALSALEMI